MVTQSQALIQPQLIQSRNSLPDRPEVCLLGESRSCHEDDINHHDHQSALRELLIELPTWPTNPGETLKALEVCKKSFLLMSTAQAQTWGLVHAKHLSCHLAALPTPFWKNTH